MNIDDFEIWHKPEPLDICQYLTEQDFTDNNAYKCKSCPEKDTCKHNRPLPVNFGELP